MPLIAFILLAVVCVAIFGFACACLSNDTSRALEQAVSSGSALPPLIEVWSLVFVAFVGIAQLLVAERRAPSRASPIVLQRFLF